MKKVEALYTSRKIRAFAKKIVLKDGGTMEDVETVMTETAMTMMQKIRNEEKILNYEGYFIKILSRKWTRESERQRKKATSNLGNWLDHLKVDPEKRQEAIEQKETLLKIINAMKEPCASLLYYYYYEGLPFKEIVALKIFKDTPVKDLLKWAIKRKYRCKKKLLELLRDDPDFNNYLK